jgi:hypothetical protein
MAEFLTNKYIIEKINELQHLKFINNKKFIGTDNDKNDIDTILDAFKIIGEKFIPIVDIKHTHYPLTALYGMTYDNVDVVLPNIIDVILDKKNLDGSKRNKGAITTQNFSDKIQSLSSGASSVRKYLSWRGNAAREAKHNLARILYFIALDNCDGIRSAPDNDIQVMYKITATTPPSDDIQMIPVRIPNEQKLRLLLFYIAATIADNDIEGDITDYNPVFRFYENLFEIQNRDEVNTKNALLITTNSIIESFNNTTLTLKGGVNNTVDLRLIQSILCGHIILYKKDKKLFIDRFRANQQPSQEESVDSVSIDETTVKDYIHNKIEEKIVLEAKIILVVGKLLTVYGNAPQTEVASDAVRV